MTNTTRTARQSAAAAAPAAAAPVITPDGTLAALAGADTARPAFGTDGWVAIIDQAALATYRTGDRAGMAQVRSMMTKRQAAAYAAGDVSGAFDAAATLAALAPAAAAPVVIAPFVTMAERVLAYRAAADAIEYGTALPDGIEESGVDRAALAAAIHYADAATLAAATQAGATFAAARITRAVGTNSVFDLIAAAFADAPVGTFMTVAQIRTAGASAATAGHVTRDGAIAARLFPAAGASVPTIPAGIVATPRDASHAVRGATKTA